MEFQLHPDSSRGPVRSVQWGRRGELWATAAAGMAAALAVSLWITVPILAARSVRAIRAHAQSDTRSDLVTARREWRELQTQAGAVRDRAFDAGDRLSRIAFLYGVPVASWPRGLNPETGLLAGDAPAAIGSGGERYLANLERGRVLLEDAEAADGGLAARTPSRLPVQSELVEPSAYFGPRVSPWTRAEEFFPGIELAAPAGSEVIAPAEGTVIFVGHSPAKPNSRLSRLGNLVVLRHGAAGVTLYGHLKQIEVRKGERVRRGQRLGTVGSTGWAVSPGLHYEYWRGADARLAPTDPQFAILDRRMGRREASLEKMQATSAAGPLEPPPGL
jgi:murein DD-endopeptidase MepM/ murein hydrolase activator NlpD